MATAEAAAPAFRCIVLGQPVAQGSKRHVGNGRMIEASAAVEPWREAVKHAANRVAAGMETADHPWTPLDGPLAVGIVFTVRKPASAPKRRRTWPDRKPDIDKLQRAVFDALTDAGIWRDDAQVVDVHARKVYPADEGSLSSPGCVVCIWKVTDEQAV